MNGKKFMKTQTAMEKRERPIIFSADSVRAILENRKTMARRVLKVPKRLGEFRDVFDEEISPNGHIGIDTSIYHNVGLPCPYGKVGDLLWVRETWAELGFAEVHYRADIPKEFDSRWKWKPSIHLPKYASRITLEIKNIRAERLQDISEEDAIAEGLQQFERRYGGFIEKPIVENGYTVSYKQAFFSLWDKINGKRAGCSVADNPFCWRLSFRVLEGK